MFFNFFLPCFFINFFLNQIMNNSCLICKNTDKEVSKFRFPKNPELRKKWEEFCKSNGIIVYNDSSRICQLHFATENITNNPDAVPTINVEKCSPAPLHARNSRCCLICGKCNSLEKVSTFQFPKDPVYRNDWIEFCKLYNHTVYPNSRLCSKHFSIESFKNDPNLNQPRLKLTAVPTLNGESVTSERIWLASIFSPYNGLMNVYKYKKLDSPSSNDSPSSSNSPSISTHCCLICGHNKQEKLSHFSFPKNCIFREEWFKFCESLNLKPIPNSRLCSKHFTKEDYLSSCRLKPTAIPTLHDVHDERSISHQNEELPSDTSSFPCNSATPTRTNDELPFGTSLSPSEEVPSTKNIQINDEFPSDTSSFPCNSVTPTRTNDEVPFGTSLTPSEEVPSARTIRTNDELPSDTSLSPCEGDPSATPTRRENIVLGSVVAGNDDLPCKPITPTRTGIKRKSLRYLNDFTESDVHTPRKATKFLRIAKTTVNNLRIRNKALQRRLRKANTKIANLTQLTNHLSKEYLSKESTDHIMVNEM